MSEPVSSGELSERERDEFLSRPIVARLATVSHGTLKPHVVPVWFLWDGTSMWISSYRSTRKSRDLALNPFCSVVVDESTGALDYQAVVMEGQVEILDQSDGMVKEKFRAIYAHYLGPEGVLAADPQEWIHDPDNTLIKLTPDKIISWFSRTKAAS